MSRSVTAELVMEEGGFDRDLPFLEKRPPRIAIADRSGKLIERSGTLEKVRTTYWGQGGVKVEEWNERRGEGWWSETGGAWNGSRSIPRWMRSETDEGRSCCETGSIKIDRRSPTS